MFQLIRFQRLSLAALATVFVLLCSPASAQTPQSGKAPTAPPPPTTREEARDMLAGLPDTEVRKLLLEHLDRSLPESGAKAAGTAPWLISGSGKALERVQNLITRGPELDDEFGRLLGVVAGSQSHPWLGLLAAVALCLIAGALLEGFILRPSGLLGGLRSLGAVAGADPLRPGQVVVSAAARSVGAVLFLVGSVLALLMIPWFTDGGRTLAGAAIWIVGGTRLVSTGIRALLLPTGGESPWPLSEPVARALVRHLSIVTAFVMLVTVDRHVMLALDAQPFFVTIIGVGIATTLIAAILVATFAVRRAMGPALAEGRPAGAWAVLRDRWQYLVTAYVLAVLALAVYGNLVTGKSALIPGLASLALLLLAPVLDFGLRALAARLAPDRVEAPPPAPPADEDDHEDDDWGAKPADTILDEVAEGPESAPVAAAAQAAPATMEAAAPAARPEPAPVTMTATPEAPLAEVASPESPAATKTPEVAPNLLRDALVLNFRLLLALFLIKVVGSLWGIRFFDLVEGLVGEHFAAALLRIAIASLFAFVVWQILKAAVQANAPPEPEVDSDGAEMGGTGLTRAQTLTPLIAKTLGAVLAVMLVMISLSSFGVDIGPVLAGAGILGLAIGFGAQTLVRDIVSGVFFLVDDAFRMGEYLAIGNIRGTVEKISVRSLRMRHHRGPLHTLPYGEIKHITNYSRDYAIMKFELRVPFETDVETVRKLIKQVGAELAKNEELAAVMLEPLKSQGVNRMDDSAFVIRCKFTTLPGKQFTVRRHAYAMIQEAFEREGIHFAPKRVIVETVAPPGSKEALAAVAGAAADAQEDEQRRA